MRRSPAATHHLLWMVAWAAIVAVPVLSVALPGWRLPLAGVPNIAFDVTASGSPDWRVDSPADSRVPVHAPASPASAGSRQGWALGLLLLWGAGTAAMLARTLTAGLALARLGPASGWQASAEKAARAIDIMRMPRTRQSASGTMPMAFGIFRPTVCLPEEAASWGEARRRMVLLHEMAHIRRGDTVWHPVARFALSIYWWNPLAWIAWRECVKQAEAAADDLVLAAGTRASDYAALLLDVAREFTRSAGATAALAMARRSQLEGRLIAILDERANRRPQARAAAVVAILAALLVVPVAAVHGQDTVPLAPTLPAFRALAAAGGQDDAAVAARVPSDIDDIIRNAIEQNTHEALDQAAKAAEVQSQYDAAQKLLDFSLQIRRQQTGNHSAEYAEGLMQLGDLAGRRDKLDQATTYYSQAADVCGDKAAAARPLLSLGVTQILRKAYDQAFETFQRAEVLDPSRAAMATAWMAVVRERQPDTAEQAENLYRQALGLAAPDSSDAAVISRMLAGYLASEGRIAEADELKASVNKPLALPQATPGGGVYKVGGGVSAPKLTYKLEPGYSQEALAAKLQGAVTLYVEIGADGSAHSLHVTKGLGLGLDERAAEAVSQWRFQPGTKDGQAVTVVSRSTSCFSGPTAPTNGARTFSEETPWVTEKAWISPSATGKGPRTGTSRSWTRMATRTRGKA
jgi:TonB family protein